jgi:hypothetical protein
MSRKDTDDNVVKLPVVRPLSTEEQASEESKRKTALFAWCDVLLKKLGLLDRIAQAATLDELRRVIFDDQAAKVTLAIRDALHPANGKKDACFQGLKEPGLRRILKMVFGDKKKDREKELQGAAGSSSSRPATGRRI